MSSYDLVVIGGGSMGLSTAYHASKRGLSVLVLEKFGVLNNNGSSAGASRQFRLQYAQQYMSELAIASQEFWAELQSHSHSTLVRQNGSLWFGDPGLSSQEGGIKAAEFVMDKLNIPYTALNAKQIQNQYAFKNLPQDYEGFFQANGGIINLKAAEQALYDASVDTNLVDIHEFEEVIGIDSSVREIVLTTVLAKYSCEKLAICTGAYVNQTLRHLGLSLKINIWQMSSAYFKKTNPDLQLPTWFVFQKPQNTSLFYGFPEVSWSHEGYIRVATDFPDKILSKPSDRTFVPDRKNLVLDTQWVKRHMTGLDPIARFTSTCLMALAQDKSKELLLDYAPKFVENNKNIVTYTAGWAAKFIPILGDMITKMLYEGVTEFCYGQYTIAQSNFKIDWQKETNK